MKKLFIIAIMGLACGITPKAHSSENVITFEGTPAYARLGKASVSNEIIKDSRYSYRDFTVNLDVFFPNSPVGRVITGYQFEDGNSHEVLVFVLGELGPADSIESSSVQVKFSSDGMKKTKIYLLEGDIARPSKKLIGEY